MLEKKENQTPTFLKSKLYIDFSRDEDIEFSFDELLRHLLNAPLFKKPDIGKNPFRPLEKSRPDRTTDGVKELMKIVVKTFNSAILENVNYHELFSHSSMPRLKMDKYFKEAANQGLVNKTSLYIRITDKGYQYLEDHELIDA